MGNRFGKITVPVGFFFFPDYLKHCYKLSTVTLLYCATRLGMIPVWDHLMCVGVGLSFNMYRMILQFALKFAVLL